MVPMLNNQNSIPFGFEVKHLIVGQFGTGQFGTGQFGTQTIWHQDSKNGEFDTGQITV